MLLSFGVDCDVGGHLQMLDIISQCGAHERCIVEGTHYIYFFGGGGVKNKPVSYKHDEYEITI